MLPPAVGEYAVFSGTLRRLMRIDHVLDHIADLKKFQGLE